MLKDKSIRENHLALGVCYYPEHWDESLWKNDLDRMKENGLETERVFEFAWSVVEPEEGEYDFSLFDRFLALCAAKGMKVILCTPTATPPAWLTAAHPEVLNKAMDGTVMHHGHRRHYNYNSEVYREYTRKIVTSLAERYGLDLPTEEDWGNPAYLKWLEYTRETLAGLAGRIRAFIKEHNPDVALILRHNPDVIMHEVNNAVDRPLPLWKYWAGEVGRESRTAHPDKPVTINSVMFLDLPYRFSAEQPGLVGLHLAQTIAVGANPYAYVVGTTENQPDRKGFGIVGEMLRFHRGVARLALATKAPVIPVGIWGSQVRWPKSGRRYGPPWRPRLAFVFGDVVAPEGDPTDVDDLAAFTQRVREAIEVQVARACVITDRP
jgi:hypothetical protein